MLPHSLLSNERSDGASHAHLFIHPNYHSGGAEIAGNWPPAWAAYLAGALKTAGFDDLRFIDAMTNNLSDEDQGVDLPRRSRTSSARPRSRLQFTRPNGAADRQGAIIPKP